MWSFIVGQRNRQQSTEQKSFKVKQCLHFAMCLSVAVMYALQRFYKLSGPKRGASCGGTELCTAHPQKLKVRPGIAIMRTFGVSIFQIFVKLAQVLKLILALLSASLVSGFCKWLGDPFVNVTSLHGAI